MRTWLLVERGRTHNHQTTTIVQYVSKHRRTPAETRFLRTFVRVLSVPLWPASDMVTSPVSFPLFNITHGGKHEGTCEYRYFLFCTSFLSSSFHSFIFVFVHFLVFLVFCVFVFVFLVFFVLSCFVFFVVVFPVGFAHL